MEYHHATSILVVEDEVTWQTILSSLCESAGYTVVATYDASDALHQSRRLRPPPILALVDLELLGSAPSYDGLRVLEDFCNQGIYTIVVSGHIDKAEESLVERPEVCALIQKYHFNQTGFCEDVFVATLRKAVAYAEAARRAEGQLPEQQARLHSLPFSSPLIP